MSREVLVQVYDNPIDGREYGRVFKSSDLMKSQEYSHAHIQGITRDLLMQGAADPVVAGFEYDLPGLLQVSIAPGHAVDEDGYGYDQYPGEDDVIAQIGAANVALPRIDLIVAVLAKDQEAEPVLLPHRKLLTELEVESGVEPGDPVPFNVATERRNTVTIAVRAGVANADPVPPAAGPNEVPLYRVRVEAGAVALTADKITDVRPLARSLYDAWAQIDDINQFIGDANLHEYIDDRVNGLFVDSVYFTKNYNDPGNLLTLDLDVAAMDAHNDARYVNVTGDAMTGALSVVREAAGGVPVVNSAIHGENASTADGQTRYGVSGIIGSGFNGVTSAGVYGHGYNGGGNLTSSVMGVRGYGEVSHYDAKAYGGYFEAIGSANIIGAKTLTGVYGRASMATNNTGGNIYGGYFIADNSSASSNTRYGIYAAVTGAGPGTAYAGYFDGDVNIQNGALKLGTTNVIDSSRNAINLTTLAVGAASASTFKALISGGNGNQLVLDNAGEQYTQVYIRNNNVTKAVYYWDNTAAAFVFNAQAASSSIRLYAANAEAGRFDASATAGDTRFLVYDVSAGALVRVSRGAADSGGVGFRLLRIPN
ncbi:MAG TPA: hypothetical protein VF717_09225 [Pyrinomonadaceae bacterium]|jgi:hypothetical protein